MSASEFKVNRREFLQKGAMIAAGTAAVSSTALSYSRIPGANDRISLGHIGIGSRGEELDGMVAKLSHSENVEMPASAICGPQISTALWLQIRNSTGKPLDHCALRRNFSN